MPKQWVLVLVRLAAWVFPPSNNYNKGIS